MKMCIFLTIIKLLHFIAVTVAKSRMQLFSVQHLSLSLSLFYSFLDISERCFFSFFTSPLSVHCSKTSLSLKVYVWIEAWKHSRNIQILSLSHTNLAFLLVTFSISPSLSLSFFLTLPSFLPKILPRSF